MAGTSSARPEALDAYSRVADALDATLAERERAVEAAVASFTARNRWGRFDAEGLLASARRFVELNREDSRWVRTVAAAFRSADATGVASAPDAVIESALRASGFTGAGRADLEVIPAVATGEVPTSGYANDPVNAASGNFIEAEVDLAFGATLRWLQVRRTYNSLDTRVGPFGPGWSSWASTRVRPVEGGSAVTWEGPDGQVAVVPVAAGPSEAAAGVAGFDGVVRAAEPGDGWVVEWPGDGAVWRFDGGGRLVGVGDGPGSRVELSWDGDRLVRLVHERGRSVAFEWRGERIVAAVADDGRRVAYGYDDLGRLVSVEGAAGGRRRYEVDAVGRVVAVVDADGVVAARNRYDAAGRVAAQETPFGRTVRFTYLPGLVTVVDDDCGGPVNTFVHDRAGRLLGVSDGHGRTVTRVYDERGRLAAAADRRGATTTFAYDDLGRLVREVRPGGVVVDTAWDRLHRPVSVAVREPGGEEAVTRVAYAGASRVPARVVDPEGGVTSVESVDGLVGRVVDADGVELRFGHDAEGRVVALRDGTGGVRRFEWDERGLLAAVVSPGGARCEWQRDAAGLVVAEVDATGGVWRVERSAAGRVVAMVDPLGARRELRRGRHGEVDKEIDPAGAVSTSTYDQHGNVVARVSADGAKWAFSFDALMRVVGVSDPAGGAWCYEHDAEGALVATITPDGTRRSADVDETGRIVSVDDGGTSVTFEHDGFGRAVAQVRPDGTRAVVTRDRCGRIVGVREAGGGVTRFGWSPGGRLVRVEGPEGGVTTIRYDGAGRPVEVLDAEGGRRRMRHDADGRVVRVVGPMGEEERFTYDPAGRLVARRDPAGGLTRFAYDPAGRLVERVDPTGGVVRWRHDRAGRVVAVTDPTGGEVRFEHDAVGRVVATADPTGRRHVYDHDEMGRVVRRVDPGGFETRFVYDRSGRLVRRLDPDGARWWWRYDGADRVAAWGVEGGPTIEVQRDLLGRVVRAVEGDRAVALRWDADGALIGRHGVCGTVQAWHRDRAGRVVGARIGDVDTERRLDRLGRWVELRDPAVGIVRCQRDGAGRPVRIHGAGFDDHRHWARNRLVERTVTIEANHSASRRNAGAAGHAAGGDPMSVRSASRRKRDAAGRLVGDEWVSVGSASRRKLDAAGRLVEDDRGPAGVARYAYDPAGQLVAAETGGHEWRFAYDRGGRLRAESGPAGDRSFAYDPSGRLVAVEGPDGRTSIRWDPCGRRVAEHGPAGERRFEWDALGRLTGVASEGRHRSLTVDPLGELAAVDGQPIAWDPTGAVPELRLIGDTRLVGPGAALAYADPSGVSWLDPLASSPGAPGHDPWGAPASTAEHSPRPGLGSGAGVGLGFLGELDVDGLTWLRARPYDSATRSFLAPDPLPGVAGVASAANPWGYAGNDPIGAVDPSGLRPLSDAELTRARDEWQKGAWDRYGGYVVGGLLIVGGVALMATGVGGIAGAALIGAAFGGGLSAITQQATTGTVNWTSVMRDAAIGAVAGGTGAAIGGATTSVLPETLGPIARGVIAGTAEATTGGMAGRALNGEEPFNPAGIATDVLTGSVAGGVGGRIGTGTTTLDEITAARPASGPPSISTAAESKTTLYRAVSSAERADIESFGGFRQAVSGRGYEGKLFATTGEDATGYGRINYGIDNEPFHIVEATVPTSLTQSLYCDIADSMRYFAVDREQITLFNRSARIDFWDYVPWVTKT
ncbi:MAG: RHS repeat-associated core domain-containing protein [Actinobacteria bacterium]|nr:RHS repeat-associated core domain-containing protein [Actinomycetota bacterium]